MQTQGQADWWFPEVEGIVRRLIEDKADLRQQEEAWDWIGQGCGPEALAAAKKLFAEWSAAEPKEKPEAEPDHEIGGQDASGAVILSKASPYDSAKEFARRHCLKEGVLALYWYNGSFWEWNGRCYETMGSDKINKAVWKFLDEARSGYSGDTRRFLPRASDVEGLIKGLKALLAVPFDPPCWLDGRPARNVLVFKNGVVDIDTGELSPLTPRLWIHHELDFDYDPVARCPLWERWLSEVFQDDAENQACVEEQLGLGMTSDVSFHRGFLWIGKKGREGKGTLAHVLQKLCSPTAYVSLSFHDWMRGDYSAEAMIGKKAGVFPDTRFKEGKWWGQNYDPGGMDHASKEMALKITGADDQTIRRKYNPVAWQGVLPMKMYLISNKIPNFNDPILEMRFIKIAFKVSFRDREDRLMREKLEAELPGIANRCLRGYRRLCQRGKFIQPASGLELAREVARANNPVRAFLDDMCVLGDGGSVQPKLLFKAFCKWCIENGEDDLLQRVAMPSHLARLLKEKIIELADLKPFREHGEDRVYLGIRLKDEPKVEPIKKPEPKPEVVKPKEPAVVRPVVGRFLRRL